MTEEAIATEGEVTTETPVEAPETAAQAETTEPADTPEQKPKEYELPKGVQRRIDRLTRARYEAEAKAKMLEERLSTIQPAQPQQPQGAPRIEDFQDFDAYITAKAKWIAAEELKTARDEWAKSSQQEREFNESRAQVETWSKRLGKAASEIPDLTEVIEASDAPMPPHIGRAIMDSDHGPQVAYWLAKNPEEAERIAELSPMAAVKAIGRIEEKIESGLLKAKKPTQAPAPITPAGQKATASKNPDDLPPEEWVKWREAELKKKRG